jgi:lipoprotein-anchoring transpeptidase ErfK/SrfK
MARSPARGARVAPPTRPRYRRITAAVGSVAITVIAVLGGIGWLPADAEASRPATAKAHGGGADQASGLIRLSGAESTGTPLAVPDQDAARAQGAALPPPVPAGSGQGHRVVFDKSEQRVWLVDSSDQGTDVARRTYPVSGSVTDNLQPGGYAVYSRSRHAIGVDDSGTMEYMVRFAHGPTAAIGFHDIPVKDGVPVQSRATLGTPQSHGCIRQWRPDAKALWRFAPVGTVVVVVA